MLFGVLVEFVFQVILSFPFFFLLSLLCVFVSPKLVFDLFVRPNFQFQLNFKRISFIDWLIQIQPDCVCLTVGHVQQCKKILPFISLSFSLSLLRFVCFTFTDHHHCGEFVFVFFFFPLPLLLVSLFSADHNQQADFVLFQLLPLVTFSCSRVTPDLSLLLLFYSLFLSGLAWIWQSDRVLALILFFVFQLFVSLHLTFARAFFLNTLTHTYVWSLLPISDLFVHLVTTSLTFTHSTWHLQSHISWQVNIVLYDLLQIDFHSLQTWSVASSIWFQRIYQLMLMHRPPLRTASSFFVWSLVKSSLSLLCELSDWSFCLSTGLIRTTINSTTTSGKQV